MPSRVAPVLVALGCLLLSSEAGPGVAAAQGLPQYRFAGLRGRVVSAEDGRPLAGAFVLAMWTSHAPEPYVFRAVRAIETTTAADGTFTLAPWDTPLANPLNEQSPALMFFAPGRIAAWSTQNERTTSKPGDHRLSLFDGQPDLRASQLRKLASNLGLHWVTLYGQPPPRVLSALDTDWRQLPQEDQGNGSPSQMFDGTVQAMRFGYEQELLKRK